MHYPDVTWTLMSLVVEILGWLPGPDIGSRIDSKSAYIINGTLNWNCPSEYSTIGALCGISILIVAITYVFISGFFFPKSL